MHKIDHIIDLKGFDKLSSMLQNRDELLRLCRRNGKRATAKRIGYDYSAFCLWIKHTEMINND